MLSNDEFMDIYTKGITEEAREEETLQDYFECVNDYLDGTMAVWDKWMYWCYERSVKKCH